MARKEDYQTSTVDGAAGFEAMCSDPEDNGYVPEYEDDNDNYEDKCNCSDPGCPCSGHKIGGL
ncbi:MAG TPA: hypothetical protein VFC79_12975 [Tissierellaceae bacterium]|nr:hypothetical protein [Tissierellaceae bacterium]